MRTMAKYLNDLKCSFCIFVKITDERNYEVAFNGAKIFISDATNYAN